MDIERLCLEKALSRALESGSAQDEIEGYMNYLAANHSSQETKESVKISYDLPAETFADLFR